VRLYLHLYRYERVVDDVVGFDRLELTQKVERNDLCDTSKLEIEDLTEFSQP
jgi:hypothetical protein